MKFLDLNITHENLDWKNIAMNHDEADKSHASYWIVSFLSLTYIIGTVLLGIIIQYEKYGEDPQKRGLSNQVNTRKFEVVINIICLPDFTFQLMATVARLTFAYFWFLFPLNVWSTIIPPITYNAQYFWYFLVLTYLVAISMTGWEIMLIRFWIIVVTKRMLPLMDDFFGWFLQWANVTVGLWMALVGSYSDDAYISSHRMQGLPPYLPVMSRIHKFQPR